MMWQWLYTHVWSVHYREQTDCCMNKQSAVSVICTPLRPMPLTTQSSAFKFTIRAVITTMCCMSRHVNRGLHTHHTHTCTTHEHTNSHVIGQSCKESCSCSCFFLPNCFNCSVFLTAFFSVFKTWEMLQHTLSLLLDSIVHHAHLGATSLAASTTAYWIYAGCSGLQDNEWSVCTVPGRLMLAYHTTTDEFDRLTSHVRFQVFT